MQNQARPTRQKILRLSIGLGGIIHTICVPVLAKSGGGELAGQDATDSVAGDLAQSWPQMPSPSAADIDARPSSASPKGISEPSLPQFSTTQVGPSTCASSNSANAKASSQVRDWHGHRVEKQTVQKEPSELNNASIQLAWTNRSGPEAESQWLKSLVDSGPCHLSSANPQTNLPAGPQKELLQEESPLVASLLDEAQLDAELQGRSLVSLDELIQIADSQQVLSPEAIQGIQAGYADSDYVFVAQATSAGTENNCSDNDALEEVEEGVLEDEKKNEDGEDGETNACSENSNTENIETNLAENQEADSDEWLQDLPELVSEQQVVIEEGETLDDELGSLRLQQLRSRNNEELGILRLLQTAEATPPPPKPPIAFLTGRLGFFDTENAFRSQPRADEQIYQSGLTFYLFPKLSESTSLYGIAETNLARYENFDSVNYNELEVQLGIRQRLFRRTYAQIGWRNQRLYEPGYREQLFNVHYIDTLISHRRILNAKTWLDGFYQMRLGFADPDTASRLRQTFTLSLNYGATRDLRTSLIYQLDFDDYTQVSRFDTYQQVLGIISYNLTPESRISVFGGTRFGRSSIPQVNLNDTFYGAGLNVNVPLF